MFRVKDGTRIASFPFARGPICQAMSDPRGSRVGNRSESGHSGGTWINHDDGG
jgi:hypothetical protein